MERFGAAGQVVQGASGRNQLLYPDLIVRFDLAGETVSEFTIVPDGEKTFRLGDVQLDWSKESLIRLCELDGDPHEKFGFILLFKLGVGVTGLHDGDESQRAITVCPAGVWDTQKSGAVPVNPTDWARQIIR